MKNKDQFKIVIPENKIQLDEYYRIRFEVLRKPWGQEMSSTADEWEEQSLHALMYDKDLNAVAAGRLQFNSPTEGQIRSMAVVDEQRGNGLGSLMLKFLEEKAIEAKLTDIVLDSRDAAVKFYIRNGYVVEGDSYTLFGVIPHFRMKKKLSLNQ